MEAKSRSVIGAMSDGFAQVATEADPSWTIGAMKQDAVDL